MTVQRKIPIPKWTLNLSATGGKKEFEAFGVFAARHHSGFYTLNEPGFRINTITTPTSLKYPRCWLPLKFGRSGSSGGGIRFRGGIRGVYDDMYIRNAPFEWGNESEAWSIPYASPSYNWVATQTNTTVKVRTGICNGTPPQESLLCTIHNVGALITVDHRSSSGLNGRVAVFNTSNYKDHASSVWNAQGYSVTINDALAVLTGGNTCTDLEGAWPENPNYYGARTGELRNVSIYECVGFVQPNEKVMFALDSVQLSPGGTRRFQTSIRQNGGRLMDTVIDTCPDGGKDRCWCKITCPKGMQHAGTDGSTCMGGGLPRCDLGHCGGPGSQNLDPRTIDGKMIKCQDLKEMGVNFGPNEFVATSNDLYAPTDNEQASLRFGDLNGWRFDGTLHEISIESLPVHYDQLGYNTDYKTGTAHVALTSTPSVQGSPVELFVAGTLLLTMFSVFVTCTF